MVVAIGMVGRKEIGVVGVLDLQTDRARRPIAASDSVDAPRPVVRVLVERGADKRRHHRLRPCLARQKETEEKRCRNESKSSHVCTSRSVGSAKAINGPWWSAASPAAAPPVKIDAAVIESRRGPGIVLPHRGGVD